MYSGVGMEFKVTDGVTRLQLSLKSYITIILEEKDIFSYKTQKEHIGTGKESF